MNPISNTAYYCCGVRMDDAERTPSLCNDRYARRFMDAHGQAVFAPFRTETIPNISNITRCRIIDDLLRDELAKDRGTTVITIGAGFDTRPYRLAGGRWIELDEPQVIDTKNARLSVAECPNPLKRIDIRFATDSLVARLAPHRDVASPVVVIEGVFMYLEPEAIECTLRDVRQLFPNHVLLCDLMNRRFFERFAYRMHRKIVAAGAAFTPRPDDPASLFLQHGYRLTGQIPMITRASELGILQQRAHIPPILAKLILRLFRDMNGYAVHRFEA